MKSTDVPAQTSPRAPTPKEGGGRRASSVEQELVNRFRAALEARSQGGDLADESGAAAGSAEEDGDLALQVYERDANDRDSLLGPGSERHTGSDGMSDPGDLRTPGFTQTLAQPGTTASAMAAAATLAPGFSAAVVAQLLEKHVKQLLVSEPTSARDERSKVMLNLTDTVLPGTQLTLTQTDTGWRLDSRSTSTASYRTVRDLAPQLQERFSERGLGELLLDVRLL